jgi:hypothetical protein
MAIIRRTCLVCGIVTRCDESDADFIACAHKAGPFEVVNEDEEAATPPPEE